MTTTRAELARAERALIVASLEPNGATPDVHAARIRAAAAGYVTSLAGASPFESVLRHDCEDVGCAGPVVHAEHWYEKVRYWCAKHTPWSGHYEHCGEVCEKLCCDGATG